jgi:transcriptional regulator with XRE-family HTH domain
MAEYKPPKVKKAYKLTKPKPKYDPAKQSEGIKKRIAGAGLDPAKQQDTRNFIEKGLNLKEGQNAIFDIFEVLNRPQQALFGGIEASIEGKDFLEGARKGITGEKETQFKQILNKAGVTADSGEKWGWDDTLGFLGDVFVDPIDWAIIPLAGAMTTASALYKSASVVDTISDTKKAAEAAADTLKGLNLLDDNARVGFLADAATGLINPSQYLRSVASGLKKSTSVTNVAFKYAGKGIKTMTNTLDWGISTMLNKIDDFSEVSPAFREAFSKTGEALKLAQDYDNVKDIVKRVFDSAAKLPKALLDTVTRLTNSKNLLMNKLLKRKNIIETAIKELAEKSGISADEISKRLYRSIEQAKYNPLLSLEDYMSESTAFQRALDEATKNKLIDKIVTYTRVEGLEQFTRAELEEIFSETVLENGIVAFFADGRKLKSLKKKLKQTIGEMNPKDVDFFKELLTKGDIQAPKFLSQAQLNEIKVWENLDFLDVREKVYTQLRAMLGDVDDVFNTTFKKFPDGYIRRSISDKAGEFTALNRKERFLPQDDDYLFSGNFKKFADRKFKIPTQEANIVIRGGIQNLLDRKILSDDAVKFFSDNKNFDFFTEDLSKSINEFIEQGAELGRVTKIFNEVVIAQLFDDPTLMKPWNGESVPIGMQVISKEQLVDKARQISQYSMKPEDGKDFLDQFITKLDGKSKANYGKLKEYIDGLPRDLVQNNERAQKVLAYLNSDGMTTKGLRNRLADLNKELNDPRLTQLIEGAAAVISENKVLIDKSLLDILGITINRKAINPLLKLYDGFNNMFKTLKLLTPGFHMRNIVGNFTNLMLSGADLGKFAAEAPMAIKVMTQGDAIFTKTIIDPLVKLTGEEQAILRYYNAIVSNGFQDAFSAINDLPPEMLKALGRGIKSPNLLKKALGYNAKLNEIVDKYYRINGYIYASKNPAVLANLGLSSPEAFVRRVFFDPNDLTSVEKDVFRRLVPFYTFTKKNLAYQMKNLPENATLYKRLQKGIGTMWDNLEINDENVEQYKLDNFWIPVTRLGADGKYMAIKLNLPVGDLGEFAQNPFRRLMSSTSPLLRAPFEAVTNKSIYTDLPISEFEGQRGFTMPGVDRYTEYWLTQAGLDVPIRAATDLIKGAQGAARGDDIGTVISDALLRTVVGKGDINRTQRSRDYAELKQLQNLLRYYKQENIYIPTINELENKRNVDYYKNVKNLMKQFNK